MNAPSPEAAARPETLHRRLGVWQVSIAGVGVILGAGVYALVAPAAAHAVGALWLSFLIASVAALEAYGRPENVRELQNVVEDGGHRQENLPPPDQQAPAKVRTARGGRAPAPSAGLTSNGGSYLKPAES